MYIPFNPNPNTSNVGDCTVRAISKLTGRSWGETYIGLATVGYELGDMPNSNRIWGEYLKRMGYRKGIVPDTCPDCYTVRDFCEDHPKGKYAVATDGHVVAVINGNHYDSFDSSMETPIFYWKEE